MRKNTNLIHIGSRAAQYSAWYRTLSATLLSASLVLGVAPLAQAQAHSADAAAQQVLEKIKGEAKVLSVREKKDKKGSNYFEVRVISKGNVKILKVPRS